MDSLAPLPKDPLVVVANCTTAEWEKKTKEFKRKKKLHKQQERERGEETDSDDDHDDDDEDDKVVADIEWGDTEGEDALTGAHPLM